MTSDCKCFDGLYKSQHEDLVSSQVGEFLDAVQSMVEGKSAEQGNVRHFLDPELGEEAEQHFVPMSDEEVRTFDGDLEYQLDLSVPQRLRTAFGGMLTQIASDARNGRLQSFYADGNISVTIHGYGNYDFEVLDQEDSDYETVRRAHNDFNRRSGKRRSGREYNSRNDKNSGQKGNKPAGGFEQSVQNETSVQPVGDNDGYGAYLKRASREVESGRGYYESGLTDNTLFMLDEDYLPLAEKYDAGIATEEETEELQADVLNAAKEAMLNTKIADENGSMAQ